MPEGLRQSEEGSAEARDTRITDAMMEFSANPSVGKALRLGAEIVPNKVTPILDTFVEEMNPADCYYQGYEGSKRLEAVDVEKLYTKLIRVFHQMLERLRDTLQDPAQRALLEKHGIDRATLIEKSIDLVVALGGEYSTEYNDLGQRLRAYANGADCSYLIRQITQVGNTMPYGAIPAVTQVANLTSPNGNSPVLENGRPANGSTQRMFMPDPKMVQEEPPALVITAVETPLAIKRALDSEQAYGAALQPGALVTRPDGGIRVAGDSKQPYAKTVQPNHIADALGKMAATPGMPQSTAPLDIGDIEDAETLDVNADEPTAPLPSSEPEKVGAKKHSVPPQGENRASLTPLMPQAEDGDQAPPSSFAVNKDMFRDHDEVMSERLAAKYESEDKPMVDEKNRARRKPMKRLLRLAMAGVGAVFGLSAAAIGGSSYEQYLSSLQLDPTPEQPITPPTLDVRIAHAQDNITIELPKRFTIAQIPEGKVGGGLISQVMNAFYHGATPEQVKQLHALRDFIEAEAKAYDQAIAEGKNFDEFIEASMNPDLSGTSPTAPGLQYAFIKRAFERDRKDPHFRGRTTNIAMVWAGEMIHIDPVNNPLFKALFAIRNNGKAEGEQLTPAKIEQLSVFLAQKAAVEKNRPVYDADENFEEINTQDLMPSPHGRLDTKDNTQDAGTDNYLAALEADLAVYEARSTAPQSPTHVQNSTAAAAIATLARLDAMDSGKAAEDGDIDGALAELHAKREARKAKAAENALVNKAMTDYRNANNKIDIDPADIGEGLRSAKDEAIIADALAELAASRAKRAAKIAREHTSIVEQPKPAAWHFEQPGAVDALEAGWDAEIS